MPKDVRSERKGEAYNLKNSEQKDNINGKKNLLILISN